MESQITREAAWELLRKYNKDSFHLQHALTVEGVMLGRIVVLPEYRHQGLGTLVVQEAEKWANELGFTRQKKILKLDL